MMPGAGGPLALEMGCSSSPFAPLGIWPPVAILLLLLLPWFAARCALALESRARGATSARNSILPTQPTGPSSRTTKVTAYTAACFAVAALACVATPLISTCMDLQGKAVAARVLDLELELRACTELALPAALSAGLKHTGHPDQQILQNSGGGRPSPGGEASGVDDASGQDNLSAFPLQLSAGPQPLATTGPSPLGEAVVPVPLTSPSLFAIPDPKEVRATMSRLSKGSPSLNLPLAVLEDILAKSEVAKNGVATIAPATQPVLPRSPEGLYTGDVVDSEPLTALASGEDSAPSNRRELWHGTNPKCPSGFYQVSGDCPGAGTINNIGGWSDNRAFSSCAAFCNSFANCDSFEYCHTGVPDSSPWCVDSVRRCGDRPLICSPQRATALPWLPPCFQLTNRPPPRALAEPLLP